MTVYDTVKDLMLSRQPGVELNNPQRLFAGGPSLAHTTSMWAPSLLKRIQEFSCFAGFVAGSASTAATYPLEALRTHISLGRRGGYVAIVRDIVRERVIPQPTVDAQLWH